MQTRIKKQIDTLVNLQDIENRKAVLVEGLDHISKQLEALDQQLEALRQTITEQQTLAQNAKTEYKSLDLDLQQNQTLIKKSQNRLTAVKNSREYQALLKETEDLKSANARIEEQMLACMNQQELSEKRLLELQQEEQTLAEAVERERAKIKIEKQERQVELQNLKQQWQTVASELSKDMMVKFERLKQQRQTKGVAIVPVENAVCRGCNVNLPPQAFNELKRYDSIKFCPNCQRMIYWIPPEAVSDDQ